MSTTHSPAAAPAWWTLVGRNVAAKAAVMLCAAPLSVLSARLIITDYGVDAYSQFSLIASLTALVPFADLGVSAAIVNRVAGSDDPRTDPEVRGTLVASLRLLICSAAAIILIGATVSALGLWRTLLGNGLMSGGETTALLCVVVFALTLPLGIGQRVLNGLSRNHVQVLVSGMAAPLILVSLLVLTVSDLRVATYLALLSYLASTTVAAVGMWLAARALRPQMGRAVRDVPRLRTAHTTPVFGVAVPQLVQMLALPIAMQTDRLLLSHLSDRDELARYALAAQLFGLVLQTVYAAGIALWPVFARARADGQIRSPVTMAAGFAAGGFAGAGCLALLLPWVAPIVASDKITLTTTLALAFVLFVTVEAAKYPLGMYMTDERGLRFQILPILVLVPLNLGVSWWLIGPLGAAGPVLGSAEAVFVCQVLPNFVYVRRDLARRRTQQSPSDGADRPALERP